jgi:hypothetical protein
LALNRLEEGDERARFADPSHDGVLRLDHLQRHRVELCEVRAGAVGKDKAIVATIIRFADRGVDADLGGHAADDQLPNAVVAKDEVQVGRVERAFSRLVDDRLEEMASNLRRRLAPYRRSQFRTTGRLSSSHQEHDGVVRSVVAGDPARAHAAMLHHVDQVGASFEKLLLEAGAADSQPRRSRNR